METKRATTEQIKAFLDMPYWLEELNAGCKYFRTHDDNAGEPGHGVSVVIGNDGDAWIETTSAPFESCRFRTYAGGGKSLRVRAALTILALAIEEDNREIPQNQPTQSLPELPACPDCAAKDAEIYGAVSIMQGVRSILGDYMTNRNIDKSVRQGMRAFLKRHEEGKREYDHAQALKASRTALKGGA